MSPYPTDSKKSRLSKIFNLRKHPAPSISSNATETPPSLSASSTPYTPSLSTPSIRTPSTKSDPQASDPLTLTRAAFIPSLQLDLGQSFSTDSVIAHIEEVKKKREEEARREKQAREEKERMERERREKERIAEIERRKEKEKEKEVNTGRRFQVPGMRVREGGYRKSGLGRRRKGF